MCKKRKVYYLTKRNASTQVHKGRNHIYSEIVDLRTKANKSKSMKRQESIEHGKIQELLSIQKIKKVATV